MITKNIFSLSILFLLTQLTFAQDQSEFEYYEQEIIEKLDGLLTDTDARGVTASIYYDGEVWSVSRGTKKAGEPIENTAKYHLRSVTKTLISTIILQLQEEGLLDINDPLGDYIADVNRVDMTITLRELLSMRANVCDFITNSFNFLATQPPTSIFDTREHLNAQIPSGNCNSAKNFMYNDTNFQLLGLVIEEVTQKAGEDVFKERLFDKFDNSSLVLSPMNAQEDDFNGVWTNVGNGPVYHGAFSKNSVFSTQKYNAGLAGNTEEALELMIRILEGEYLSDSSLNDMMGTGDYGLGLMRRTLQSGDVLFGHGGAGMNASRTFYNMDRKIGVSVASNMSHNMRDDIEDLMKSVYQTLVTCVESEACQGTEEPTPGELTEYTFDHEDVNRSYFMYVPESYQSDMGWPLIVNFHGYTGDVPDHIERTKMHELADQEGFLIAYPVGLTITRDPNILPSFVPMTGAGWSVPGFSTERNEILFVEALLDDIENQFSVDEDKIHTTGLSLGGYMAGYIGTQMPERIASFASVAGHFTKEVNDLLGEDTQKSALLVHGTADVLTAYDGLSNEYQSVESVADAIASNNNCSMDPSQTEMEDIDTSDNTTVTLFKYSECDSELVVHLYRVNEGGHRWPGSGITEPAGLGFNSKDISTSELVFEFFIDNPMPESDNNSNLYAPVVGLLQEILDNNISTYGIEGVATTIVFPNEEVHTIGSGFGQTVNDPIDVEKRWHWASGTKPMTGFVTLKLIEDGLLSIDDPVGKFLDTKSIPNLDSTITVKRLLQHTSGLSEIWSSTNNSSLWQEVWNDRDRVWDPREFLNYMPAPFDGLTEHYYASSNSYILSFIIEEVTGKSLEDNFQEFIFDPLGMTTSYLSSGKDIDMSEFNGAWLGNDNRSTLSHTSYLSSRSGNSAHIATSEDQVKFYSSYYSGELLSSDLMDDVNVPAEGSSEVIFENYACISKVTQLHGYETTMFEVISNDGREWNLYGHGGNGIHNSFTYHWEQKDLTIAMVINDFQVLEPSPFAALIFDVLCKIDEEIEDIPVSNEEEDQTSSPVDFTLSQNYPNPFNPSTNISFDLPQASLVQLKVYNLLGQEVASLVDERRIAGNHTVNFDASQLSSGVYIYRLNTGSQSITKKMMLIK